MISRKNLHLGGQESLIQSLKRFIIGKPLHNQEIVRERLPKWKAMAIFSSDALSSVAYGPEMVILMLSVPGFVAYGYVAPVSLAILLLLAIVTISYVQVAKANPGGGGSYSVGKKNLGEIPALMAAAALLIDYSLTVAVSISSGTDAIISALPVLIPYRMGINLFVLFGILMIINLRGVRESATAFVFPTYGFIFGIFMLVGTGIYQAVTGTAPVIPQSSLEAHFNWAVLFLALKAFSNGCSSMTGVEAISNGVPMFKEPEYRNAQVTTYWMSATLGTMFLGITFLNMHFHFLQKENITMLSQLAESVFGRGFFYYYIQVVTMLILFLAANTAYNGLPPLLSLLARDGYMPRYLSARGDRLSFSNGIVFLSIISALLIIGYQGNTEHLISLYAVGVFLSFTIAQSGMVIHWRREGTAGWKRRALLNGVGAAITGIVVVVIMVTKFTAGAWLILFAIPGIIFVFKKIHSHYQDMREQLVIPQSMLENHQIPVNNGKHVVIVPVAGVNRVVANTLGYAKRLSPDVVALYIATDDAVYEKIKNKWDLWNPGVELVAIKSPFRTLMTPLLRYIDEIEQASQPDDYITVLIPEFETKKWWHRFLHNQTGFILRNMLIFNKHVAVTVVPYHLEK